MWMRDGDGRARGGQHGRGEEQWDFESILSTEPTDLLMDWNWGLGEKSRLVPQFLIGNREPAAVEKAGLGGR